MYYCIRIDKICLCTKYTKSPAEREKQGKLLRSQNYHRPWSAKDYMQYDLYVCVQSKNLKGPDA